MAESDIVQGGTVSLEVTAALAARIDDVVRQRLIGMGLANSPENAAKACAALCHLAASYAKNAGLANAFQIARIVFDFEGFPEGDAFEGDMNPAIVVPDMGAIIGNPFPKSGRTKL
jgi:hypothetical protein